MPRSIAEHRVLAADEGTRLQSGPGRDLVFKVTGEDTGGAFALVEAVVPPGGGPPPHVHSREDEAFYVLEGELTFHADGRDFTAGPGAWITLAKGSLHHFLNRSPDPARMLILVTPAGLEQYFLEVGREAADGETSLPPTPEDIDRLLEAAPRYGLDIRLPAP